MERRLGASTIVPSDGLRGGGSHPELSFVGYDITALPAGALALVGRSLCGALWNYIYAEQASFYCAAYHSAGPLH